MNVLHPNRNVAAEAENEPPREPLPATPLQRPAPCFRYRYLWIWAGAIGVLYAATLAFRSIPADKWPQRSAGLVPTVQVQTGTLQRVGRLSGTTQGENSLTLLAPYLRGSRTRGGGGDRFHLVLEKLIADGSQVAEGDTVATFDQVSMFERIDDLKADRDQVAGNLSVLAARLAADREARNQRIRVAKATMDAAALDLKTAPVRSAIQAALYLLSLEESRATHARLLAEAKDFEDSQAAQVRFAQLSLAVGRTRGPASRNQRGTNGGARAAAPALSSSRARYVTANSVPFERATKFTPDSPTSTLWRRGR